MTIQQIKQLFEIELISQYSLSEIQFLASVFIEEVVSINPLEQKLNSQQSLSESQLSHLENYISLLKTGQPYQQILGYTEFFGLRFMVNENVLIPRPETEEVLEFTIQQIKNQFGNQYPIRILDIGTGSGIIPIVLKKHFPNAEVTSIDISEKAIEVAKKNAVEHKVTILFEQKDYLNTELNGTWDLIISNPPYIGIDENDEIANSVKYFEPNIALFSPTRDALIFYRKIAQDAQMHLSENGIIVVEINQKLGQETLDLFHFFPLTKLISDISGNDRIIFASRKKMNTYL